MPVFILLITVIIGLFVYIKLQKELIDQHISQVTFHIVQANLVRLESNIRMVRDNGWKENTLIDEKLMDIQDGIAVAMVAAQSDKEIDE